MSEEADVAEAEIEDAPQKDAAPQAPGTAVAVVRERIIAHSPVAIWDTADFEHMGRVAAVMAESGLMSDSFLKDGNRDASPKAVVARCLLVASIARECDANPLIFLQHASVISKKIHFEGKLVNALVRKRTGIELSFRFGVWDIDHIVFPPVLEDGSDDESFLHGVGDKLAIRVWDPERPARKVDGYVALWRTERNGSPWSSPNNWPRQLRYRGVPEWARAYEPGAILGIYSEADDDTDIDATPRKSGVMARLSGEQAGAGFDADHVERETKPKRTRKVRDDSNAPEGVVRAEEEAGADIQPVEEPEEAMHARVDQRDQDSGLGALELGTPARPQEPAPDAEAPAEPAPAASSASGDGTATEAGSEATTAGTGQKADDDFPPELDTFIGAVENAQTFADIKIGMVNFFSTEFFQRCSADEQNHFRRNTWETVRELKAKGLLPDLPDHATDITAFRLWIEWCDDRDAILGTQVVLENTPAFQEKAEATKNGIRAAVDVRTAYLLEG